MAGQIIEVPGHGQVEFPADMSDADIVSAIKKNSMTAQPSPVMTAISNIPGSAASFAGSIYNAVSHPVDTASNLLDVAAGGLKNITPEPIANAIDKLDPNPQAADRAVAAADATGQFFKNRYGGLENIKNTLITDPVGAAADASALLSGGASLTSKIPAVSNALKTAASITNPVNAAVQVAKVPLKVAGAVGRNVLGLTTGVGSENIGNAAKAGYAGDSAFMDNLRGKVPMTDVLDAAQQNLQKIQADNSAKYRSGMVNIANDKSVLDFGGIDNAINKASSIGKFKG
ncbi:MAG TPA: hypothetical protein VIY48_11050, partial [Candidatus Paceibacterota bacterium]